MIKKSFILSILLSDLLLISALFANAQTTPPVNLPQIILPSPEAASLGKYGDLPVGMFTGHPNITIPLYQVTTKHLSMPISLNYNVNGIKVNELSSNVGMSWALNCGGVISRTVYGFADFGSHTPYAPPTNLSFNNNPADARTVSWLYDAATTGDDTQMDAFNFNFNGYSGKFFIVPQGYNGSPTIKILTIPYSNINVQYDFTGTDWNFKITTPDGVIYYFGGRNATEITNSFNTCESSHQEQVFSAWYLTKIQHPFDISDSLHFSYLGTGYSYETGINQLETYWDRTGTCTQDDPTHACTCGPSPFIYGLATATIPLEQFCLSYATVQTVYLQSITDGKYNQLVFDYVPKTDAGAGGYLLSNIIVKNNQTGQNIKSFSFNYQTASPVGSSTNYSDASTKLPRPFLIEVDEWNDAMLIKKPYKFDYNDFTKIAPRLSFSQDYWGYNNGVSNGSGIPLPEAHPQVLGRALIANRNPDYTHAAMGLLNKVTYPTGGYTTIQYEGNTTSTTYSGATSSSNYSTIFSQVPSIQITSSSTNQTFTVPVAMTVTITAELDCNCPSGTGCPSENDNQIWGNLISNSTTTLQSFNFAAFNARQDCSKAQIVTISLQPGITYRINILPVSPYQLTITILAPSGNYLNLPSNDVPNTNILQSAAGGLRVQRVVSYDPITNNTSIKRYFYDQAIFPAQPSYYHHVTHKELRWFTDGVSLCDPVDFPVADAIVQAGYHQFSSNSFIDIYGISSSPVYYKKVIESFGDNYENGGIEHDYSYNGYLPFTNVLGEPLVSAIAPQLDWRNGLELSTKHFKIVNGVQIPVESKAMTYQVDARNSSIVSQYVIEKIGNMDPGGSPLGQFTVPLFIQLQNYNVAQVNYISEWQYLSSEIAQSYDVNGNPTVTTTKNYYYDNPAHALPTRIVTTNSKGELETIYQKYPLDYSINSAANNVIAQGVQNLQLLNIISPVIEKYAQRSNADGSNARTISGIFNVYNPTIPFQNTVYTWQSATSSSGYLPAVISNSNSILDAAYQPTINLDKYDGFGNLIQQHKQADMNMSYIWGYFSTYPIAEVKNASQSDIAYTSFEDGTFGTWDPLNYNIVTDLSSPTGTHCFLMSGASFESGALTASKTYILSYWSKNGSYSISGSTGITAGKTINGWTYYEHTVTGVANVYVVGSGSIDELRLYPQGSQMTTYTYTPLVGMTSQCDADNRITYYFYDGFQRLSFIKDQDGNIIKTFQYHYQNQ